MNRRGLATVVALALAAGALLFARSRDQAPANAGISGSGSVTDVASSPAVAADAGARPAETEGPQPKEVVWKMVDASKARDVAAYLDCFAGDLRARLDGSVRELGEKGFADYLGRRVEELKGVALYDVEIAPGGGASLTVEYVFANEKELQRLHLEEAPAAGGRGGWRITGADESRREKSLIPYGTPIEQVE